jgi:hypothetical protein
MKPVKIIALGLLVILALPSQAQTANWTLIGSILDFKNPNASIFVLHDAKLNKSLHLKLGESIPGTRLELMRREKNLALGSDGVVIESLEYRISTSNWSVIEQSPHESTRLGDDNYDSQPTYHGKHDELESLPEKQEPQQLPDEFVEPSEDEAPESDVN